MNVDFFGNITNVLIKDILWNNDGKNPIFTDYLGRSYNIPNDEKVYKWEINFPFVIITTTDPYNNVFKINLRKTKIIIYPVNN